MKSMRMTKIVGATADVFYPFCLVFGLYVVAHGHLTPGGGFQGGAVMATGSALMIAACRHAEDFQRMKHHAFKLCEAVGLLLFIGLGYSAFMSGGTAFFYNWLAQAGFIFGTPVAFGSNPGVFNTGGVVPLMNIAVGLEVLGGLSIILLTMIGGMKENLE